MAVRLHASDALISPLWPLRCNKVWQPAVLQQACHVGGLARSPTRYQVFAVCPDSKVVSVPPLLLGAGTLMPHLAAVAYFPVAVLGWLLQQCTVLPGQRYGGRALIYGALKTCHCGLGGRSLGAAQATAFGCLYSMSGQGHSCWAAQPMHAVD